MLHRQRQLCSDEFKFVQADVRDGAALDSVFTWQPVESVIHFAELKAVGESVTQPLRYFDNNSGGTASLLRAIDRADVRRMVFSSSATAYGDPQQLPLTETAPLKASNPYGSTKLICEDMLRDLQDADARWQVANLRYINLVGAHPSGLIGEAPSVAPKNLMPYINQVAMGKRDCLSIFGNDYPTPDGNGMRDYIHVTDLARDHVDAWEQSATQQPSITVNLGTGHGVSVQQLVDSFVRVTRRLIACRPGDVAACYADVGLARTALGWQTEHEIAHMCEDAWRWQSMNPTGYAS